MINLLLKKAIFVIVPLLAIFFAFFTYASEPKKDWNEPIPIFKQEFDWLKLSSNEWLKGDIISMYDEELEFDSEELDMQTIDWEDVAELRSRNWQSIRMQDGTVAEGYLVIKDGNLSLVKYGKTTRFELVNILSIAASAKNERDLWDSYVNLGLNLSRGNTEQFDYTFSAGIQRRSASSRFKVDYISNFSKYEDKTTKESFVTVNRHKLTSTYDWFFSQKIYLRAVDFEYTSDEFLNINYRLRYGVAVGYHLIDTKLITWDVNAGPSYQTTQFIEVDEGAEIENSPGLVLGTDFTYEITKDIDYEISYSVQIVNEASGQLIHQLDTGLKIDLTSKFDLDLTFYADRTEKPSGDITEKNDYRLVISLGYDF